MLVCVLASAGQHRARSNGEIWRLGAGLGMAAKGEASGEGQTNRGGGEGADVDAPDPPQQQQASWRRRKTSRTHLEQVCTTSFPPPP